jgi:hypothetical protein
MANYNTYLPTPVGNVVGATTSTAGTAGLVPAPAAGSEYAYLRGDATFKNPLIQQSFINTTQEGFCSQPLGLYLGGSLTPANDILYLTPHIVIPATYTKIFIRRSSGTSGASMKVRMGIYECDFDKLCPTTLIAETADTSMGSVSSDVVITISQTLNKGIYFLGCVFTSSSGWLATSANTNYPTFWGTLRGAAGTTGHILGFTYSHTYGALPSSITASSLTLSASTVVMTQLQKT